MRIFQLRSCAAITVAVGALAFATSAGAATLSVDDDRQECPAAEFTTIQSAIDQANKGDTVAVCPGKYVEGSGNPGSNALTINKNLTLKGAGADDVTILPRPIGGQSSIAATSPTLRGDGVGNIIGVIGDADIPITVDISGVTVDGNGVASEAGVLFLDAKGSFNRSLVTHVVTSMGPNAFQIPGGYRSASMGYGIVQVSAATVTPSQTAARVLTIDQTRVDGYNTAGILVAGTTGDTYPLTNSPVASRAVISNSQVVGRTQCVNFEATGSCGASQLALLTTGTLFGQDGIRVAGNASTGITGSLVTQNLVNGTGSPTRPTNLTANATNNANLVKGAGVRFVGATASTIATSNIVDNAYGVQNVSATDGTTALTSPRVNAENNWWGLNYYRGGATGPNQAVNAGPAISPTTNPPIPENPVNGAAVADTAFPALMTSTAVDFVPFRDGPQSSEQNGEFVIYNAPGLVNDAAPAVKLYNRSVNAGGTITITPTIDEDFGVRSVAFYDGATKLGTVTAKPYTLDYTLPAGGPCGIRTITVVAEDSLYQTGSDSAELAVQNCPVTPDKPDEPDTPDTPVTPIPPAAPAIAWATSTSTIDTKGTEFGVVPTAAAGVAKVEYLLGTRKVCTTTSAPFSCKIVPTGADTGSQSLRVVITDTLGRTAEVSRQVTVARFAATLSLSTKSKAVKGGKVKKTITGKLKLPKAVTKAQGCKSGSATVVVKSGSKTLSNSRVKLSKSCSFSKSITVKKTKKKVAYTVSAKFGGNTVLLPTSNDRRFS